MNVMDTKDNLVRELSKNKKIKGIGQTGDINADLIPAIAILTCLFYVLQFQQRPKEKVSIQTILMNIQNV